MKVILERLEKGEENAVSAAELGSAAGLAPKKVNAAIHRMRVKGAVILSSNAGYFYPDPEKIDELRHFVRTMRSRCREIRAATASAKKLLLLWEKQASDRRGERNND